METKTEMKILEKLINEQTFVVVDHESNRFNFFGLIEVIPEFVQESKNVAMWNLTEDLPNDVKRAIEVMAEDVELEDFTGIIRFERDDDTYYLLVWEQE